MFAVSPFEVVYKIKKTTIVAHDDCMGRCLPPSVGCSGWPYRRGPWRLDTNRRGPRHLATVVHHDVWWSKLINFEREKLYVIWVFEELLSPGFFDRLISSSGSSSPSVLV
jgi:hypothetical protein